MRPRYRLTPLVARHSPPSPSTASSSSLTHVLPNPPNPQFNRRVRELEAKLAITLRRLDELETHTNLQSKHFDASEYDIGILNYLHLCEFSPFHRRFICSQSSAELYGILSPTSQNYYGSPDKGDAWIQFEFHKEITVFGFIIQSYLSCFIKSYHLVSIDSDFAETILFATTSEDGLNGELKEVTHTFQPAVETKIIRFEQTGTSWSGKNFIGLKRMDFLTDQCPGPYFEHLLRDTNGDPHKLPVNLTARYFDVYSFLSLNPDSYICTFDSPTPSWFQIEFINGRVSITGYRLKKHDILRLKQWTLRGTNDPQLPLDRWIIIHSMDEPQDSPAFGLYRCPLSEPFKFIRLVMDSLGWNDRAYLAFWHFEIFGDLVT
jgi:hypothetical protein